MNIPTLIVIAIVAMGVFFALRSLRKKKGGCGCGNCNACGQNRKCPGTRGNADNGCPHG